MRKWFVFPVALRAENKQARCQFIPFFIVLGVPSIAIIKVRLADRKQLTRSNPDQYRLPHRAWRGAKFPLNQLTQRRSILITDLRRDRFNRQRCGFNQMRGPH